MPVLVWLGKFLLGTLVTTGGLLAGDAIVGALNGGSTNTSTTPTVTTSFDWQGLLTAIAIAGAITLVGWLIFKRRK